MTHLPHACGRCEARWAGSLTCHCPTCHLTFTGVTHFDKHRKDGQCRKPADIGLVLMTNRPYEAWGTREES